MTRPKTPTGAYQKDGKYHTGESVWVLDGGKLSSGGATTGVNKFCSALVDR